jgi:PAS domain-containing protein
MKQILMPSDDLLSTFAQQRQLLLKHTADLLCTDGSVKQPERREREAQLSAILVSSLEELKVAEEELVERTDALARIREEIDKAVRIERQLFDLAPVSLIVTDIFGNIVDLNQCSAKMLKRDRASLEKQPLAEFVAAHERRSFREGLARVVTAEGVSDWRLLLVRPTAGAISVSAAVCVIKGSNKPSGLRLLWSMRVLEDGTTAFQA